MLLMSKTNTAFVYQWWGDKQPHLYFVPILTSIATLRGCNRRVPIYVLDYSGQDWSDWPKKLNFEAIHWTPKLSEYVNIPSDGSIVASRFWDVWEFAKQIKAETIAFCDADVFWLRNPLPIKPSTGINMNGNAGYFYFNKLDVHAKRTMHLYRSISTLGFYHDKFREQMISKQGWRIKQRMSVEITSTYMRRCRIGRFNHLKPKEHVVFSDLNKIPDPQMIHFWECGTYQFRARLALLFQEFYNLTAASLSQDDITLLMGKPFNFNRISLCDPRLLNNLEDNNAVKAVKQFLPISDLFTPTRL